MNRSLIVNINQSLGSSGTRRKESAMNVCKVPPIYGGISIKFHQRTGTVRSNTRVVVHNLAGRKREG